MKTSFVEMRSIDNIAMHGILFEPDNGSDIIVIHHHGMEGNFYENTFISFMAQIYTEKGISFLTYNNRGHDYICDLKMDTTDGVKSIKGGTAYENIGDNANDVEGAVNYCKGKGYRKIVLQGHSSGANKVVYAMATRNIDVFATVLLSPCDDYGLYISETTIEEINAFRKIAKNMIDEGKTNEFMPRDAYMGTLISPKTYLECSIEGSAIDVFPYRDSENEFEHFSKINTPIFVTFGTGGDYVLQEFEDVEKLLNEKKSEQASISFNLIEGAPHNYRMHERELAEKISDWICNL